METPSSFNMIGEYIAATVNSMSAESLVSLMGLNNKEASTIKKGLGTAQAQKTIGSYASRKITTTIPVSLWSQLNKTIQFKAPDLEQVQGFKSYLQSLELIGPNTKASLLDFSVGDFNVFHLLRNKMIKASLKYSLLDAGQTKNFASPADAILIMAVAGAPLPFPDFSTYKTKLLDSIGINDSLLDSISSKVSVKDIASKVIDSIDDDEFLNDLF